MSEESQQPPQPPKVIVPYANFPQQEADSALSEEQTALQNDPQAKQDLHADKVQARTLRERFSWVISGLVFAWMVAIYTLLIAEGMHSICGKPFALSEKIMIAALGTVTLNVVGLLVIILKFVFPNPSKA